MKPKTTARRRSDRLGDLVEMFRWGDGTYHVLGEEHCPTRADAEAGWTRARRAVWATWPRFSLPYAAESFDALTHSALEYVRTSWNRHSFNVEEARALLGADRASVEAFRTRNPAGAATIGDFLVKLENDLDAIEGWIRARACASTPSYPHHLSSARLYGDLESA